MKFILFTSIYALLFVWDLSLFGKHKDEDAKTAYTFLGFAIIFLTFFIVKIIVVNKVGTTYNIYNNLE